MTKFNGNALNLKANPEMPSWLLGYSSSRNTWLLKEKPDLTSNC